MECKAKNNIYITSEVKLFILNQTVIRRLREFNDEMSKPLQKIIL
jgi:hypothetical protein